MNNCIFMGNLTRDPKLNPTKNGSQVVNFGMATNRFYKRADGEGATESTYLDMEAWDSGAKRIFEMFKKGDGIIVEASAKNAVWIDKEGNEQRKIVFRVSRFYPLSRKSRQQEDDNDYYGEGYVPPSDSKSNNYM
jgi:single-strand DNA-binding protein